MLMASSGSRQARAAGGTYWVREGVSKLRTARTSRLVASRGAARIAAVFGKSSAIHQQGAFMISQRVSLVSKSVLVAPLAAVVWIGLALVPAFGLPSAEAAEEKPYVLAVPLGLDPDSMVVPENNPITAAKVELGKLLYFDPRLSTDHTISCASCHDPARGFTDQKPFSAGVAGKLGGRNSPTVINTAFNLFQFWDGRAPSLEEQAKGPIANPVEMANSLEICTQSIAEIKGYAPYFEKAFGDSTISIDRIAMAIASYERTVLSGNSKWDKFTNGDKTALSESEQRGLALFEGKALCTRCHVGFNLTDGLFHNLGVGMSKPEPDLGRYVVTKKDEDKGAFKTPTLRDLQRTAPYMHDGSVPTLEAVIDLYDRGGEKNPWLDVKMEPLKLTAEEKKDLLAFLMALEGDWKPEPPPALPK
jgi:cytochrome c peroxidase